MTDTHDVELLLAELRHVKQGHEFTRDRIGQPGCPVRRQAAEHVETLDRAITALSQQDAHNAAIEAAARVAESYDQPGLTAYYRKKLYAIASAIRALARQE